MDEAGPEQLPWVCGGRLRTRGNSGRPGGRSFHPRPQMPAAHSRQLLRAGFWLLRTEERSEKMLSDELLHNVHLKGVKIQNFRNILLNLHNMLEKSSFL